MGGYDVLRMMADNYLIGFGVFMLGGCLITVSILGYEIWKNDRRGVNDDNPYI